MHQNRRFRIRQAVCRLQPAAGLALLAALGACERSAPAAAGHSPSCGPDGKLVAELYGGIRASLDWHAAMIECDGMPRPQGAGARLRFAGPVGDGEASRQLAIILGMPDLRRGMTAEELPTNVTVIEEDAARFFSTADTGSCWTDVERQEQFQQSYSGDRYLVAGVLYCVAPLAELNGTSSLSFTELRFAGPLNWSVPE